MVRRFEPGAIVKLLKHRSSWRKQKKFAAPFIGPLIIDSCVHDDVYRLRTMDGKKLKGRSVNVERIFPYFEEDDVTVVSPRVRDLVADHLRQATPEPMPSPEGQSADDDDEDPPTMDTPSEPLPSLQEEPIATPDADQESTNEPEQSQEDQNSTTESDGEQEAMDGQDQQSETSEGASGPPAANDEPTIPTESTGRRYPGPRNRPPPDRLIDRLLAFVGRKPWKKRSKRGGVV